MCTFYPPDVSKPFVLTSFVNCIFWFIIDPRCLVFPNKVSKLSGSSSDEHELDEEDDEEDESEPLDDEDSDKLQEYLGFLTCFLERLVNFFLLFYLGFCSGWVYFKTMMSYGAGITHSIQTVLSSTIQCSGAVAATAIFDYMRSFGREACRLPLHF